MGLTPKELAQARAAKEIREGTIVKIVGMDEPVFVAHKKEHTFIGLYASPNGNAITTKLFTWRSLDVSDNNAVLIFPMKSPEAKAILEMCAKWGYYPNPKPKLANLRPDDIKLCSKGIMIKVDEGKFLLVDMVFSEMKTLAKEMFQKAKNLPVKRAEEISAEEAVQRLVSGRTQKETEQDAASAVQKMLAGKNKGEPK